MAKTLKPQRGGGKAPAKTTKSTRSAKQETSERIARTEAQLADNPAAARAALSEPMSNITDKTLKDFCERGADAYDEHKKALEKARGKQGIYRGILKDAKKAGIEPDDIIDYIKKRDEDPNEIDATTRRRNRIYVVMGLPIGTQLGLFEDGSTVADRVEKRAGNGRTPEQRSQLEVEAKTLGRQAGEEGKDRYKSNTHPLGSRAHKAFDDGWLDGQKAGPLSTIGRGNGKAPAEGAEQGDEAFA